MKTIVIGAGISGLSAAYELQKNGIDTTVLEKDSQPGGRTRGGNKDGFVLDHGAQFFMKCYDTMLSYVHEFGLESDMFPVKHNSLFWLDERIIPHEELKIPGIILRSLKDPAGLHMSLLKSRFQTVKLLIRILRDRKSLGFVHYEDALKFDREYFSDYVLRVAGKEALEYIFDPLIAGITLGKAEEIGALYGVALFYSLLGGNWVMKNGLNSLTDRVYQQVKPSVKLSTPVNRIVIEDNRAIGVETPQGFMEADAVVCSTTATVALNMLPDLPPSIRSILETVRYQACCHVVFAYDRPVIPHGTSGIMFPRKTGSTMCAVYDTSFYSKSYAPPGASLLHCYIFDRFAYEFNRMSDKTIITQLYGELTKYLPSLPKNPMFSEIYRWEEAMCFAPPGMYTAVNRLKTQNGREVKGLYFVGDYINLASVEGSARSGVDGAKAILKFYQADRTGCNEI